MVVVVAIVVVPFVMAVILGLAARMEKTLQAESTARPRQR